MLAWDGIPEAQVAALVAYVKTFSPRWKEEEPGEVIHPTSDPWLGREPDAVARGRKLYHGLAQCLSCHPSYASRAFVSQASRELTGNATTGFREDMYGSMLTDSDFGVKLLPPDFLRAELRSVRPDHRLEDLYRVIASGVGGTAMPTWQGSLPEEDLWALVHFVDSLVASKGTDAAGRLREEIAAEDAGWKPKGR
jgi:mono/diheme cytochrome c family protein